MKKLLSILLVLALVIGVLAPTAYAEDPASSDHVSHCICGGIGAPEHTCPEETVWIPVTAEALAGLSQVPAGNYCLTEDIQLAAGLEILPGQAVNLCLNGHTLTGAQEASMFRVSGQLNICDCQGTGSVVSDWNGAGAVATVTATPGAALGLYSGTLKATGANAEAVGGTILLGGTMNVYGGNVIGCLRKAGGAIAMADTAALHIFNGAISGGSAVNGGNIYCAGGTVDMQGGTVTGGSASGLGGNLYITGITQTALLTMANATVSDGTAGFGGGNLYLVDTNTAMTECSVVGGQIVLTNEETDRLDTYGYNIVSVAKQHDASLTIHGGRYDAPGEANVSNTGVAVPASDKAHPLTFSGYTKIRALYLGSGRLITAGEAGLDKWCYIEVFMEDITGLLGYGLAPYASGFHSDYSNSIFWEQRGEDLYLICDSPYYAYDSNGHALGSAYSIESAYLDYADTAYIKVIQQNAYVGGEFMCLDRPAYLDLNGNCIAGQVIASPLYVIDSKAAGNKDVFIAADVLEGGSINDGKLYISTANTPFPTKTTYVMSVLNGIMFEDCGYFDTGYYFHAVDLRISAVNLRPSEAGLYYQASYAFSEEVAAHVTGLGVALSLDEIPQVLGGNEYMSSFTGSAIWDHYQDNKIEDITSVSVFGILKEGNDPRINAAHLDIDIYARAYLALEINGEKVYVVSEQSTWTMLDVLEAIDMKFDQLSPKDQAGLVENAQVWQTWLGNSYDLSAKLPNIFSQN